ncbi:condensation domain-containing protein [Rhodococcus sp. 3Y1]
MWFANQFDPESAAYNVACALRLDGTVNLSALHAAFVDVVERHESLRTVFPLTDDGPRQVIMSTSQVVSDLAPILVQERKSCASVAGRSFRMVSTSCSRSRCAPPCCGETTRSTRMSW